MRSSFQFIDWVILGVYLLSMAIIGLRFSRQDSLAKYLLADRRMGWLPVGLSLMAALNSGMDYLMQPSSTIRYGLVLAAGVLSWIPLYPWVAHVVCPFYYRLNFFTAYEYLEARFDLRVRVLAALIFILWRLGWMATAMYVPSLAINAASGGDVDLTTVTIVIGVLVTAYTALGGIQAVIWNDVIQFCVMFGGLLATVLIVLFSVPGGVAEIWTIAAAAGKLEVWQPLTDPAATTVVEQLVSFFVQPITVVPLLISLIVGRMAQYTSDQVMVQRLQTARSVPDARRAFVINAVSDAVWMLGLSFVGLALFAYFQRVALPPEFSTDKLVPYFMSLAFPAGATGLVIAAITAASLSSIDSAINSCSSVVVVDLYKRAWLGNMASTTVTAGESRVDVRVSRMATIAVGVVGTILACNVSRIGSLLEIWSKVVNAFSGPLFGIFLLAMFSARATSAAVLAGGIVGAVTAYGVAYHSGLSFLWPSTFGLIATLMVGGLWAALSPLETGAAARKFTWRAVMAAPPAAGGQ
jgi:SSS family transporter